SRWQIVRQLLCEGFLLAICGGLIGLILSAWCNDALLQQLRGLLASVNFSFVVKLRPDETVLTITLLVCLIATMLFSLGPALNATKADLVKDLKEQVGEPARIGRLSRFFAPRRSCCFSPPDYSSAAPSRRPGLIPASSRAAISFVSSISV